METRPLHARFGIEINGVDLRDIRADHLYPEIRDLFERETLLLFWGQNLDEDSHNDLALLFGPIEDRAADVAGKSPRERIRATNNWTLMNSCNLANRFRHTDSTFLRLPAPANLIAAHIIPSSGGETEFCSTRVAYADLPDEVFVPSAA